MPNKTNPWPAIRLAAMLSIGIVIALLTVPSMMSCSESSIQEKTTWLELLKVEQSSSQSMLYLIDSIFEWEEMADDFSMHDDWMARKVRANNRLAELSVIIPDFQSQLDECNQKGD